MAHKNLTSSITCLFPHSLFTVIITETIGTTAAIIKKVISCIFFVELLKQKQRKKRDL